MVETASIATAADLESLIAHGKKQAQHGQWEEALRTYDSAQKYFTGPADERRAVASRGIAYANRCLGRYDDALQTLEELLSSLAPEDRLRLNIYGDIGILHRLMSHLEGAGDAFQKQHDLATRLDAEQQICRSVGNLGVVSYQLWQCSGEETLLTTATCQLEERVSRARALKDVYRGDISKHGKIDYASTLEAVGLARLSLCLSARGDQASAVTTAQASCYLTKEIQDPSVEAISRFFYGLALRRQGQITEALHQFNLPRSCSPAVAFCKEPSKENHEFLQELLEAGANMETPDNHGYLALDYAVYNKDEKSQEIVLESIRRRLLQVNHSNVETELAQKLQEARLRKVYREIFQERMRPTLLAGKDDAVHQVRLTYAEALKTTDHASGAFDGFKFVKYADFVAFGRFPRSNDGLTQQFSPTTAPTTRQHVVFISYRWVNPDLWARYPDDNESKQYQNTIQALDAYLQENSSIDAEGLGIWIDYACINQDDKMPGIAALPMAIAQCDALISLVDDQYHDRAWCSVEVMLIHALRTSYGLQRWYEHTAQGDTGGSQSRLRPGPELMDINPETKKLREPSDMARVLFLQRQCRLLC
ncbi:hypothetical protein HII31_05634 [Pseudocercospora fuligena]|uniref:Heterokaryon incompatibility domain-containing protein n=1 Tax=Pseudocercospora fuligena TaxID=685502 RepID=A0A8H6RLJ5_9PEZI|nr:hypothetical protein HII31_05634 [Pseudocercospora fuligena]